MWITINKFNKNAFARWIIILAFVIIGSLSAHAGNLSNITVNNETKCLQAPMAANYQWLLNGKRLFGENSREIKANKSGTYSVEMINEDGSLSNESATVAVTQDSIIIIYVISDSTVANYNGSQYPQTGWGQILNYFFDETKVTVRNRARGGRSSKSFHVEGLWSSVKAELQTGNYLFIQWGHNDRDWTKPERYADTATYKRYLKIYVEESREKGAIPVLISPMTLNTGDRNVFREGANDYRGAMLDVAQKLNVPFIDLNIRSYDRVKELGSNYASNFIFLGLRAGEYSNYPNGVNDFTHFQEMGSLEMARLISEEMSKDSTNADLTNLISALKPLYELNISSNHPETGNFTKSTKLPEGANVTLKMYNDKNLDFFGWLDDEKRLFSKDLRNSFSMPARNLSLEAVLDFDTLAMPQDCYGSYGGEAFIDICGKCAEGFTGVTACRFDCNEVLGGIAYLDSCGICVGGNTNKIPCEDQEVLSLEEVDFNQANFNLFPNPFTSALTVSGNGFFEYQITDLSGKTIQKGFCNGNCESGNELKNGVYILTIHQNQKTQIYKIIKQAN